jgi:hypothetical protein
MISGVDDKEKQLWYFQGRSIIRRYEKNLSDPSSAVLEEDRFGRRQLFVRG